MCLYHHSEITCLALNKIIGRGCSRIGCEEEIWAQEDEVTVEWRRLHNKELYDLYSSPNIIWTNQIKNEMRRAYGMWGGAGNVYTKIWWGDLMERDYFEDLGIDGTIIKK